MSDIGFYHLTRSAALAALPKLLGRTLAAGRRAAVLCADSEAVSAALWASTAPDWLPHAVAGAVRGQPDWQPIWIATTLEGAAPNGAGYLFLLDNRPAVPGFERIFDLFNGNDDADVVHARRRWSLAKAEGHRLTYWQQGEQGWVAKA